MHDVTIPALGMAMTEAVLTQWHKQPGDVVSAGDVIAEIETDKTNVDLESPADGVLGAHLVAEGDVVPVGQAVIRVLGPNETEPGTEPAAPESAAPESAAPEPAAPEPAAPEPAAPQLAAPQPAAPPPAAVEPATPTVVAAPGTNAAAPPPARTRYAPPARTPHTLSPRKRRLARLEAEADAFFAVTQEGGPTQAREAREAAAAAPATPVPAPATPVATTAVAPVGGGRYRAAIAERVAESWRTIPHFAVQREIEAGEADSCLAFIRERDPDATLTDLLLRAFALAIDGVLTSSGDVGLAVATPDGVMMPVVPAVPSLGVSGLVSRRTAAVRRAREGKLAPRDLTSVPVGSLSNLGARGVDSFTGIIPLGQQLLLTVGRVAARPVVVDGRLTVRTTVVATLNADHRHLDGDQAARVLTAFQHELGAVRAWAEGDRK